MLDHLGLPTLFITLTMAESKWTQLHDILAATDNGDTLPSNRPYHTTLHFVHRLQMLKSHIWKHPNLTGWGNTEHFFERVEFQNRGAAHLHGCYWTTTPIPDLIANRLIRSDLPDPQLEPELYHAVVTHQIHTCNPIQCGGPALPGDRCKKGFPRPLSPSTYENPDSLRYVYECHRPEDQYVVSYHPATLLAWKAHINVQYVSSRGFARYMVKYINKPEPSHVFNVYNGDCFQEHVTARRMGTMEVMFLILGETICNSSTSVMYLTTEPPESRPKAIKPVYLLEQDNDHPFWDDTIIKYFSRPHLHFFENLTYEQYFSQYLIGKKPSSQNTQYWLDDLQNFVTKQKDHILVRFRHMKIADGNPYFYQLLLRKHPWRSESDICGNYTNYREHYLALHPDEAETMRDESTNYIAQRSTQLFSQFEDLLDNLQSQLVSLPISVSNLIRMQMTLLYRMPPILPKDIIAHLPSDQFAALDCLTNKFGSLSRTKYPYYFLTGAAGTGKSHCVRLFVQFLKQKNIPFLLLAPTGVAAQNIDGKTIHSALRICQTDESHMTLAFQDSELLTELSAIQFIIVDEISMVPAALLDFMSNTFARIQCNNIPFGNVPTLAVGDLYQLPPVHGSAVFHAASWKVFHPLFLTESQRQASDPTFYALLNEVRTGKISPHTWNILVERYNATSKETNADRILSTTHLVGTRACANSINISVCNMLPTTPDQFLLATAEDTIKNVPCEDGTAEYLFKGKTNLPHTVRLQPGARVMLLNNNFFDKGLCNGSIGFVTSIDIPAFLVHVAFHVQHDNTSEIIHLPISRTTASFFVNGAYATRKQFPLQNSFALTTHKAQGVTLPQIDAQLDEHLFAYGHAYVNLSRAKAWKDVHITALHPAAFRVNPEVTAEYARLERLHQQMAHHIKNYTHTQ